MAAATLPHADAALAELAELAEDYITQRYEHEPGKAPTACTVSREFGLKIRQRLGARAAELLSHPRLRLHVFTSHGRHLPGRQGRLRTLTPENLTPAVLDSCSIPFRLDAVHDIPGAPRGAYWDGGIIDYRLHLPYAAMSQQACPGWPGGDGLVLYPHFQAQVVPGWLYKAWKRRHHASPMLDNLVLLSPRPEWVQSLPGGKLPDRADFKTFADDDAGRMREWRRAVAASHRMADEFANWAAGAASIEVLPLQ